MPRPNLHSVTTTDTSLSLLTPHRGIPWARFLALVAVLVVTTGCRSGGADSGDAHSDDYAVLWVSDLYEPVNDPDDHYDLAVGMADPRVTPDLIVLDNHLNRQTGAAPAVEDLAEVAGAPTPRVVLDADLQEQVHWLEAQEDGRVTAFVWVP